MRRSVSIALADPRRCACCKPKEDGDDYARRTRCSDEGLLIPRRHHRCADAGGRASLRCAALRLRRPCCSCKASACAPKSSMPCRRGGSRRSLGSSSPLSLSPWVAMRLARPDADQPKALAMLLLPMIMPSAAIAWEMAISPKGTWSIWAAGSNSRICLLYRRTAFRAGHRRDRQASDSRSDRRGVGLGA
jgi:hypothetical protein